MLDETQFGFKEVGKAYDRLTSGQAMGKVVVEIEGKDDLALEAGVPIAKSTKEMVV